MSNNRFNAYTYQGSNGKIYIGNFSLVTPLSHSQIHDLRIDIFGLDGFDFDLYKKAYHLEKKAESEYEVSA